MNYHTFADAWEACGETPGCEVITRWTTQGLYYLRRLDDPNLIKTGASSIRFSCDSEREGSIQARSYDQGHHGHYPEGHYAHEVHCGPECQRARAEHADFLNKVHHTGARADHASAEHDSWYASR